MHRLIATRDPVGCRGLTSQLPADKLHLPLAHYAKALYNLGNPSAILSFQRKARERIKYYGNRAIFF
jgi:hypothetical protein